LLTKGTAKQRRARPSFEGAYRKIFSRKVLEGEGHLREKGEQVPPLKGRWNNRFEERRGKSGRRGGKKAVTQTGNVVFEGKGGVESEKKGGEEDFVRITIKRRNYDGRKDQREGVTLLPKKTAEKRGGFEVTKGGKGRQKRGGVKGGWNSLGTLD